MVKLILYISRINNTSDLLHPAVLTDVLQAMLS